MSPTREEEVQDAVRKFFGGGSAFAIARLASDGHNFRFLIESGGVIPKLVDLLVNNKPAGEGGGALLALSRLQCGRVQDATARAHDGAIFAWLAGPQDYGHPDEKRELITNFTKDHPTNTRILHLALSGVAPLAESIVNSLQSGDNASAAFTTKMMFEITRAKGETSTFPDSSIATLSRIVEWDPSNASPQLSTIRAQAESVLAQLIRAEKVRRDLPRISLDSIDHLKALASETSDARTKLLAAIQLRQLAKEDGSLALKIASSGGLSALVAAANSVDDGKILTKDLQTHAAKLLAVLAQGVMSIQDQTQQQSGLFELLQLCESESQSQPHAAMGLDVFRGILQSDSDAEAIGLSCGIPLMFQLLRFVKTYCSSQESAVVRVLASILFGADDSTNEINQHAFLQCDGAVRFLSELLDSTPADSRNELSEFMDNLGWVVLEVIPRLRNGQADVIDNITTVIKALEVLSRVPANQRLFCQREGVKLLVEILRATSEPHLTLQAARILANIACRDDEMSKLIVKHDVIKPLGDMISSADVKHQTAALMTLRNLASNDTNRVVIVSLGLFPRVIELASKAESMKQRVVAAAVLGNLARLPANQKLILHHAGDDALLRILQQTSTAPQIETVAAALWVLTKDDPTADRLRGKGGAAIVMKAIEPHEAQHVPWATRLLQRLT